MAGKSKPQKPLYKKWWFWVIVVTLVGAVGSGLSGGGESGEPPAGQVETEPQAPSAPEPSETPGGDPAETTPEPVETENQGSSESQEPETADFVLDVGSLTSSDVGPLDTGNLSLKNGDLLSVNYGGDGVIVVKAKIQALFSNDQTVKQNYFTVCDLIKNCGFDSCQELQYWAVADMTNGEESKVVSFTLDRATIEGVVNDNIIENQLGDYVDDLYILPSLRN